MTAPDTDTLAELLANTTPGEWEEITPEGGIWPPRVFSGSTIVSMVDNSDMTHGEKVANARLIALAPELAARVIALEAQAAKDKARIERLEARLAAAVEVQDRLMAERYQQYLRAEAAEAGEDALAKALRITRERLMDAVHSEFDGVWSAEDFNEQEAEAVAALAAYEARRKG